MGNIFQWVLENPIKCITLGLVLAGAAYIGGPPAVAAIVNVLPSTLLSAETAATIITSAPIIVSTVEGVGLGLAATTAVAEVGYVVRGQVEREKADREQRDVLEAAKNADKKMKATGKKAAVTLDDIELLKAQFADLDSRVQEQQKERNTDVIENAERFAQIERKVNDALSIPQMQTHGHFAHAVVEQDASTALELRGVRRRQRGQ